MGKVFGVASGKGGVGKSTFSIGLATAFCTLGYKTLLVDMDAGLRCLDLMLGVDESTVFDLSDVLMGRNADEAIYRCEQTDGLYLMPAPASQGLIDAFSLTRLSNELAACFDRVIFDFPAGIDTELYSCMPADTLFLTVAVPDPVSVRDAAAVSRELEAVKIGAGLIINRFSVKSGTALGSKGIDGIIDTAALRLVGIVPEAKELSMLSIKHKIKKGTRAFEAFLRIARRLNGEHILLPKAKKI